MRNLLPRVLIAALGIPLLVLLAKGGEWTLGLLVVGLQALILREWIPLTAARGARVSPVSLALAAAGLDLAIFTSGGVVGAAAGVAAVSLMLIVEVFRRARQPLRNLGASALFLLYVCLPLSLWFIMDGAGRSECFAPAGALISLWLSTWLCDTAAYAVGLTLGKHKLYPAASPHKTIEGFVGGIAGAVAAPLIMSALGWVRLSAVDVLVLGAVVGLLGQTGDLLESLMKREAQIKDSSSLLPGHGGLLDRFDSLLLSTPFFYAYLILSGV
jgi:phosphatidate cytidylyltransferase